MIESLIARFKAWRCRRAGHDIVCSYSLFDALLGASLNAPEVIAISLNCARCGAHLGSSTADYSKLTKTAAGGPLGGTAT